MKTAMDHTHIAQRAGAWGVRSALEAIPIHDAVPHTEPTLRPRCTLNRCSCSGFRSDLEETARATTRPMRTLRESWMTSKGAVA